MAKHKDFQPSKTHSHIVEVVVAISLLLILFAIFSPAVNKAPGSAKRISCVNNLKQIGSALQQYTQDYAEKLPGVTQNGQPYPMLLSKYLEDPTVYKCPSNSSTQYLTTSPSDIYLNHYQANGGKAGDKRVAGGLRPMARNRGIEISKIKAPTQCILVAEWNSDLDNYAGWKGEPDLYNKDKMDLQGHLGTTNFLLADGHVKSLRPMVTVLGVNMRSIDNAIEAPSNLQKQMESETVRLARG